MAIELNLPKHKGLFVAGTGTGVGKTLIAGAIARILTDAGQKVGVFKPIATGCHRDWEGLISKDTEFLAHCANSCFSLATITPVGLPAYASPLTSAALDKRSIDFSLISKAYTEIANHSDTTIIESTGGVREPVTEEFDTLDLAIEFDLPLVIVAPSNPSTVNHVLMTIDCIKATNLKIAGIIINGYDATKATVTENAAPELISQLTNLDVLAVVPFNETAGVEESSLGETIIPSLSQCDWSALA